LIISVKLVSFLSYVERSFTTHLITNFNPPPPPPPLFELTVSLYNVPNTTDEKSRKTDHLGVRDVFNEYHNQRLKNRATMSSESTDEVAAAPIQDAKPPLRKYDQKPESKATSNRFFDLLITGPTGLSLSCQRLPSTYIPNFDAMIKAITLDGNVLNRAHPHRLLPPIWPPLTSPLSSPQFPR
jgi:hypothetical protein